MGDVSLTAEQKRAIKSHLQTFVSYVQGEEFRKDQDERLRRVLYFQKDLPQNVAMLAEAEMNELIAKLWASRMWGNKQYLAQKIISDNGIDRLRHEIKALLDTSALVKTRYERFLREVKGLGPASLTEMLCYVQPDACGIWNTKARKALKILNLNGYVDPNKYRLSAEEYETFNRVLQAIAHELKNSGFRDKDVDLLFVDFFLYQVSESTLEPLPQPIPLEVFDHDEIRDQIETIGVMLGFDADTEVQVGHGAKVDVVWRARIANLGLVTYVFEVHKSGSIDSLLLNLQKAKGSPTVQKVIAVSDEIQLEKIRKESEGLPEEFRRALSTWRVEQVQKAGEHLQAAVEIINSLELVKGL